MDGYRKPVLRYPREDPTDPSTIEPYHTEKEIILQCMFYAAVIVGVISGILIMTTILKNKPLRTRTNKIIVNWSMNETIFLILMPFLARHIFSYISKFKDGNVGCTLLHLGLFFPLNAMLVSTIQRLNTLSTIKKMSLKALFGTSYAFSIIFTIISIAVCIYNYQLHLFYIVFMAILIIVTVAMIIADLVSCCRDHTRSKSNQISVTIAKIHIYNWAAVSILVLFVAVFAKLDDVLLELATTSIHLTSLYVLIYLMNTDSKFKYSLLNSFRSKENKYNIDTIDMSSNEDETVEAVEVTK